MLPALDEFFTHTRTPSQATIDHLVKVLGVPPIALGRDSDGGGITVGAAYVVEDGPAMFSFANKGDDGATHALIFVARDMGGDAADLIAWTPRADKVMRLFGRTSLLGEHEILLPTLEPALRAHRCVADWLRAGRSGVVIVDTRNAWRVLEGVTVEADDVDHGLVLKVALAAPAPRILVPQTELAVAA